jgi:flavin reductase (DIM6/NTAB) family NADH-FMN oxidoreductase RutF
MHLIGEENIDWVWRFGIPTGRDVDKFAGLKTSTGVTGVPLLAGALATVECRVESSLDTGDRTIFLAEVLAAHRNEIAVPLTFHRLLKLAPADRLRELKLGMERDIELDRAAILEWRRNRNAR